MFKVLCACVALLVALLPLSTEAAPKGGGFRGFSRGGGRSGGGSGGGVFLFGGFGGGGGGGGSGTAIIIIVVSVVVLIIVCCVCYYVCTDDEEDHGGVDVSRLDEGTHPCYLCLRRVGEGAWNDGSHRKACRVQHADILSRLPMIYDEYCPQCGDKLKLWPDRGAEFYCEDPLCAQSGSVIANVGCNRLNCFVCDYDLCRACADRKKGQAAAAAAATAAAAASPMVGGFAPPPLPPATPPPMYEQATSEPTKMPYPPQ